MKRPPPPCPEMEPERHGVDVPRWLWLTIWWAIGVLTGELLLLIWRAL